MPNLVSSHEFLIIIDIYNNPDSADVRVESQDADFVHLMSAAEYMLYLAASESGCGFEKALELLCQGAMNYRTLYKGNYDDSESAS